MRNSMLTLVLACAMPCLLACGGPQPDAENPAGEQLGEQIEQQDATPETPAVAEPVGGEATKTGTTPAESKLTEQDKFDVNAVIKAHREQLTTCYDDALSTRTLPLDGFLVKAEFTIETDGRVSGGRVVETTEKFEKSEQCFLLELATIKFPPPPEGRVIEASYPFTIKRKSN